MSKRKRKKRRPPLAARRRPTERQGARTPVGADGPVLTAARVTCLIGLPALLLVSPTLWYMQGAGLHSENSLFQWNCVQALATAAAALWLAAVVLGEVPRVRVHRVEVLLIGFFVVALVSSLLVPHRFDPSRRLKEMLAGGVFFIVVKNLFADERRQRVLVRVMMTVLAVFAVLGVVHYFWHVLGIKAVNAQAQAVRFIATSLDPDIVPWEKEFGVRATSVEGNPNFLASSLLVLVPVGLAWLVMQKRPRLASGPLAGVVIWALVTVVLLGLASDANRRFHQVDREAQQLLASRAAARVQNEELAQRHDQARRNLRTCTDLAIIWTVAGTVGLVAMVWLWPFVGTVVAVVLGFALLLFTNSWAAYSGFLIGLLIFALLIYVKKPARFRPATAVALGAACAIALVGFFVVKALSSSSIIPPKEARTGARSRQILWDTVPRMVRARPLLGFGADNFFAYANKYMAQVLPGPSRFETVMILNTEALARLASQPRPRRVTLFPQADAEPATVSLFTEGGRLVMDKHAAVFINNPRFIMRNPGRTHSEYLAVLVETGVVGLALFAAVFVFFFAGVLGAWRRGEDSWRSVVSLGSIAAIAGVAVMQAVDFPFRLPWATCLIASALALPLAWQRSWEVPLRGRLPAAVRAVLVVLVGAAGVALEVSNARQVRTLQLTNAAQAESVRRGFPTQEVIATYERLVARRARDHNVYFRLPEMLLAVGRLEDTEGRDVKEHIARLERIQPYHEKVQYLWGQYDRQRGDVNKAIAHYRRALELEPRFMKARVTLIDALVEANRLEEAKAAIAEAWPWYAETWARMEMARGRSPLVKMERGLALLHAEDLYWPWVMNAEATVRALEGDFDGATKRWQQAAARWRDERAGIGELDQGPYGIYPDPPLFIRNLPVLSETTPEQVRADQAGWAKRFSGVDDYEVFKRLDDRYKANLLRSATATGRDAADAARRAEGALAQLVRQFGEEALTIDGNLAREYHNRLGLLKLATGQADEAAREFELSARGRGGDVGLANGVALKMRMPGAYIDERVFVHIHRDLDRYRYRRYLAPSTRRLTPEQYVNALAPLAQSYPHYVPVGQAWLRALIEVGRRDEAAKLLDALERLYPNDRRPRLLREQLGL